MYINRSILAEHLQIDSRKGSKNNSLGKFEFEKCNKKKISNKQEFLETYLLI